MKQPARIRLQLLTPDNWRLWRNLRLQALAEAPYAFSSRLCDWQGEGDTEERWRARLSSAPANFIAECHGVAAGMASATASNPEETIELISMWVAPSARGQGVGDALITAIVDWARTQSSAKIALSVFETNTRAVALYKRHRFVDAGLIDSPDSAISPERCMTRDLTG